VFRSAREQFPFIVFLKFSLAAGPIGEQICSMTGDSQTEPHWCAPNRDKETVKNDLPFYVGKFRGHFLIAHSE
jgi:hypothetical protein